MQLFGSNTAVPTLLALGLVLSPAPKVLKTQIVQIFLWWWGFFVLIFCLFVSLFCFVSLSGKDIIESVWIFLTQLSWHISFQHFRILGCRYIGML